MDIHTFSRVQIETRPLPGPSIVICMADSPEQLAVILDVQNVVARLNLIFNDATEPFQLVRPPNLDDARRILAFISQHSKAANLVVQCQVGIGRSQAVCAALLKLNNIEDEEAFKRGTYNRALYRHLLIAANYPLAADPLVSISVRAKHAPAG